MSIEDSFRVLKSTMDARPVYVWTKEHIGAHFLICHMAREAMTKSQMKKVVSAVKRPRS